MEAKLMVPTFASPRFPASCLQALFFFFFKYPFHLHTLFNYSFIPYSHSQGPSCCGVFCLFIQLFSTLLLSQIQSTLSLPRLHKETLCVPPYFPQSGCSF